MFQIKVVEKIKTLILNPTNISFWNSYRLRDMWDIMVQPDTPQATIYCGECALCAKIPKATNTYSECVIHIVFPLEQWLRGRASMLRYKYNTYLVIYSSIYICFFQVLSSLQELQTKVSAKADCNATETRTVYFQYAIRITAQVIWMGCKFWTVFPHMLKPLGTALPLYRTGISLLSRERFLYI